MGPQGRRVRERTRTSHRDKVQARSRECASRKELSLKTAKEYLEAEVKRLVEQAREITRAAEAENRTLTDDARMKVEGLISETNTLKSRIAEQEDNERLPAA